MTQNGRSEGGESAHRMFQFNEEGATFLPLFFVVDDNNEDN